MRDQPAGELVVLLLAHGHLHFPKRQICGINAAEHAVLVLFLTIMSSFTRIMYIPPVVSTINSEDSPAMRHTRVRGASLAMEDCGGLEGHPP
jgi:hypothetical protein